MIRHCSSSSGTAGATNVLLVVEIFVSFLVLFAVVTLAVFYLDNYRRRWASGRRRLGGQASNAPESGPGGPPPSMPRDGRAG